MYCLSKCRHNQEPSFSSWLDHLVKCAINQPYTQQVVGQFWMDSNHQQAAVQGISVESAFDLFTLFDDETWRPQYTRNHPQMAEVSGRITKINPDISRRFRSWCFCRSGVQIENLEQQMFVPTQHVAALSPCGFQSSFHMIFDKPQKDRKATSYQLITHSLFLFGGVILTISII